LRPIALLLRGTIVVLLLLPAIGKVVSGLTGQAIDAASWALAVTEFSLAICVARGRFWAIGAWATMILAGCLVGWGFVGPPSSCQCFGALGSLSRSQRVAYAALLGLICSVVLLIERRVREDATECCAGEARRARYR
jgi:hypothetical protein